MPISWYFHHSIKEIFVIDLIQVFFDQLLQMVSRKKLIDLGFVPGERLKILRDIKSGFVTVLLKGGKIALDTNSADKILVKEA